MALFNYTKPGPGVEKNAGYSVNRFALYFQLLGRKFWDVCLLSLTVMLFTVPYLAASYGIYKLLVGTAVAAAGLHLRLAVSGLPFMLYGPVLSAGFKIARDFARQEPVFLFSDFWDTFRGNLVQPTVISALVYFFSVALTYALPSYFLSPGVGVYLFFPLCLLAAVVILFIQFYAYTMAVCMQLSLREILKNSLIFSFLCFLYNALLLLVLLALLALVIVMVYLGFSYPVVFGFMVILAVCFLPGFYLFTVSFVTHPLLQRYVVEPYYQAHPQQTAAALQKREEGQPQPKEQPEYVYYNGRMVHRSVVEKESVFDDTRREVRRPDHGDT